MRIISALFAFLVSTCLAIAQPAPVPGLPDVPRLSTVTLNNSTGPVSVPFAIYGDGTDYGNWVEVYVNNVFQTPVTTWILSSPSGSLSSIARPVTNAQISFVSPQTGTVTVVGARRPRRTNQFAENAGVPARDLNVVLTDLVSQNRETWDKLNDVNGRALVGIPGETIKQLPPAAQRANQVLGFDNTGNTPVMVSPGGGGGGGTPTGPINSVQTNGGAGTFGGSSAFLFSGSTATLGVPGSSTGNLALATAGGATATLQALGFANLSLPLGTDTLLGATIAQTITNKTFDTANNTFKIAGTTITGGQGTTGKVTFANGAFTNGHCVSIDASGNIVDAGAACSAGGSGSVNAGTFGQFAWYAGTGTAVSGNANFTISGADITLGVPASVPGTLSWANNTSGTIKLQAPAGVALAANVLTWPVRTGTIATTSGTPTSGNCARFDTNGNLVDAGGPCTTGGGGGTVNSGTIGSLAYYASSGTAVSGNPNFTVNAGDAMIGIPGSIAGTASYANATSGTIKLQPPTGPLGSSVLTWPARTANIATSLGSLTSGNCVKIDAAGNFVDNGADCTGVVKSVFGRTGVVVAAANDYSFAQISGLLANAQLTAGFINAGTGLTGGAVSGGGTIAADLATVAQFEAGAANKVLAADKVFTAETDLNYASPLPLDFSTFINVDVTLTGNVTTINATNMKAGQAGIIRFIQDGTGSRTIPATFNSNFKCAGGCNYVLSTAANAVDAIAYTCVKTNYCIGGALLKALQ